MVIVTAYPRCCAFAGYATTASECVCVWRLFNLSTWEEGEAYNHIYKTLILDKAAIIL